MEELAVFARFEEVSDRMWEIVQGWRMLAQDTIGKQVIRSADSVGANLVEGDGRYSKADALHFFIIARGSARETTLWVKRAHKRKLITTVEATELLRLLTEGCQMLNNLITYRRNLPNSNPQPSK
ncbi:four helix bundle protein [Hymenobacter sp. ASUV-10]|uniref:Four helix bundle protein n=1 Tax=Hymenobacter aranciens TaxID=3063996 RepID=A0ABT9BHJ2_9BACT|nr:four helix bundle protein [Hymenobacter sp. ASUV-10]MDO7876131.1 four helix bundle protein [Hymenobacter sp. ASUV-10]